MIGFLIHSIIILVIAGICYLWYKGFSNSLKISREKKLNEERFESKLSGRLKHISGLPIIEGVYVDIFYTNDDKIILKKEETIITLDCSKIRNIENSMGKNIKHKAISGAAAGKYLLGGTVGTIIGAMAATSVYLVITYEDNDETKFIIFDEMGLFPRKLIKIFKENNVVEEKNIEL